jgi:uncharacterized protein (TIGR00297 family)
VVSDSALSTQHSAPVHQTNEPLRKSLHIAIGFGALSLRVLPWPWVAAVCAVAVLSNWLLLHRLVGRHVSRHERGWDAGIVLYPLMVLLLTLIFRNERLPIAAGWAVLAFGDGFASLIGRSVGGPRLPWNREKSWSGFAAFVAFGFVGAIFVARFVADVSPRVPLELIVAAAVVLAAIVESLLTNIDDNISVPLAAAGMTWVLLHAKTFPVVVEHRAWPWLAANAALAIAGYAARSVDVSGAIGGFVLGAILILFGGGPLYLVLLAFFILGTVTTKIGYRRKAARGLAQEKGGRRGFSHAFANVGVAAILATCSAAALPHWSVILWMAAAAALATAAADTTASEVGQLLGRRTFLPLTFRPVPVGTEGAISVEGTVAGVIAGAVVSVIAVRGRLGMFDARWIALLVACAFAGSYVESVAGSWNRKQSRPIPNGVLNFLNTLVGAALVLLFA